MSHALLDVNVLVSLLGDDLGTPAARQWFRDHARKGWASCTITQSGFVRVTARTASGSAAMAKLFEVVRLMCDSPDHELWPVDLQMADILPEVRGRLQGHSQITDAVLLTLAIRRGGRLVTLDKRIRNLLPADSPHQAAIEVIAV
ncbi:MAG: hypothetical protein RL328_2581 [Acidobacteriota bacterium]|jgi:predicted nucleic acid-binding protein